VVKSYQKKNSIWTHFLLVWFSRNLEYINSEGWNVFLNLFKTRTFNRLIRIILKPHRMARLCNAIILQSVDYIMCRTNWVNTRHIVSCYANLYLVLDWCIYTIPIPTTYNTSYNAYKFNNIIINDSYSRIL